MKSQILIVSQNKVRKFLLFLCVFAISFFIICDIVKADSISGITSVYDVYFRHGNWNYQPSSFEIIPSGNQTFNFGYNGFYGPDDSWIYISIAVCVDNASTSTYINSGYTSVSKDLSVYNTNYSCNYPNSTYNKGKVWLINYKQLTDYSLLSGGTQFTWYFNDISSLTLLDVNMSTVSFVDPRDYYSFSVDFGGLESKLDTQTDSIINNQNSNTQDIIDNQNSNTDKEIESQKVCSNVLIDKSSAEISEKLLESDGSYRINGSFAVSKYFSLDNNSVLTLINPREGSAYSCFYNSNKEVISCFLPNSSSLGIITIPSNAKYFRTSLKPSDNLPVFSLKVCENGNQAITDKLDDSSVDSPSGVFDDLTSKLATNNVISSLITLPITFYTSVLNGLNGTCTSFNLGNLLGTDIILPCINISNYVGNTLWSIIDILFSGFFILHMSKKFISVFDNMSSLKDGDVIDD